MCALLNRQIRLCVFGGERKLLLSDSSIFSDMTHLGRFIITLSKAMEPLSGERACAGVSAEASIASMTTHMRISGDDMEQNGTLYCA